MNEFDPKKDYVTVLRDIALLAEIDGEPTKARNLREAASFLEQLKNAVKVQIDHCPGGGKTPDPDYLLERYNWKQQLDVTIMHEKPKIAVSGKPGAKSGS